MTLPFLSKLANVTPQVCESLPASGSGATFMVRTYEMFLGLSGLVDTAADLKKAEEELEYQRKFLASVQKKLGNPQFTAHAPEKVVAMERKKEADSLSKIQSLESRINALKNNA